MGSCSSLSNICSPDFKPTFIHLITMKFAMRLILILFHRSLLELSKNPPTVEGTFKIGSPDFKLTYIRLITMKHAMRLLLVFPHRCYLEFSENSKISQPLANPDFNPTYTSLMTMKLAFEFLFLVLPIDDFWSFPRIRKILFSFPCGLDPEYFIRILKITSNSRIAMKLDALLYFCSPCLFAFWCDLAHDSVAPYDLDGR